MDRFSQDSPSLAAHKAHVYGDEPKQYCEVCDQTHYEPMCEPEPEDETGCTVAEQAYEPMQATLFPPRELRCYVWAFAKDDKEVA
jgi:hypothetical protein